MVPIQIKPGTIIIFLAKNHTARIENILTRFLDDWAYQANVRQALKVPDVDALEAGMKDYENVITENLNAEVNVKYTYPWERLFEVEVEFN